MSDFNFNISRFRQIAAISMVLTAFCSIFPPDSWTARVLNGHAPHLAVGLLALAFVLLFLKEDRLMLVAMGSSAAISFFLNEATNGPFPIRRATDAPRFKIAHFNASEAASTPSDLLELIQNRRPDIVSVQEITPFFDAFLRTGLKKEYPHIVSLPQAEFHGIAVFSKTPIAQLDTFWAEKMPNLRGATRPMGFEKDVFFIASIMIPTVAGADFQRLGQHLAQISFEANQLKNPLVAFGEYNAVPWAPEIQAFRRATRLRDARQPMKPTVPNGYFQFMDTWLDCLLCSDDFECIGFEELSSATSRHLGIEGIFQLAPKNPFYEKGDSQFPLRFSGPR